MEFTFHSFHASDNFCRLLLIAFADSSDQERSDLVVECWTRDRRVAGLRLTRGIALCPLVRLFILCLVLVQPRKTCPNMTEEWLPGM